MSSRVRSSMTAILAALAAATASSCGGNDLGADIAMVISPTKTYLLPGTASSCLDFANAKNNGTVLSASVNELRLSFPQLLISWTGKNKLLYVAYIRVFLQNPNISGGTFDARIAAGEVEAILGIPSGAAFNGQLFPTFTSSDKAISSAVTRTYSDSSGTLTFPPCSFMVGGVTVTDPRRSFQGTGRVELVGFSVQPDGKQMPVRKSVDIQFEYLGTQ